MNDTAGSVLREVKKVIHGKDNVILLMFCAVIAGGHVLLEDIPGVGKTTLALAFSRALSLGYRRVQFTPDVMPSDLLGFKLYDRGSGEFRFQEGSIYTNLFLADEINRTSPKTQSALLEVMEERRATVEGETRELPSPFFVLATQNPFGSSGTQKLPESQLDRFMICLSMGYPDFDNAVAVLKGDSSIDLDTVNRVTDAAGLKEIQAIVHDLPAQECIFEYVVNLTEATRDDRYFALGLSPRGSIALMRMARARAFCEGRNFVIPEDIQDVFGAVAGHRVRLNARAKAQGLDTAALLDMVIRQVPVPKVNP
ncbi:MAG: MoxR family ATPase [Lachnospiraceae bacterium]|nr:MoxR family ATPase [Lachnospiraceae bacterium]